MKLHLSIFATLVLMGAVSCKGNLPNQMKPSKVESSVRDSVEELTVQAEIGNHQAQYCLASKLLGDSLLNIPAIDQATGVRWLLQSAEGGYESAQEKLAWLYATGRDGVEKNPNEAFRWYQRAADNGGLHAIGVIASSYASKNPHAYGMPFEQDYQQSLHWYQRGGELGDAYSTYMAGTFYRDGTGVERDLPKALSYFQRAAEAGENEGGIAAALLLLGATPGIPYQPQLALTLLERAADQNFFAAQRELSTIYSQGKHAQVDNDRSFFYLVLSAANAPDGDFDLACIKEQLQSAAKVLGPARVTKAHETIQDWVALHSDEDDFRHVRLDVLKEISQLTQPKT